ncbi:MAG: divergent polysaccharide deacetylase family protein [Gammaproteobacteria bacterium]|nr:divergent polysaccharide deacetylase family protein [Gammaproteobacteria bacterium]
MIASEPLPTIAIIIDDMGYQGELGDRAIALPGAVTYAFLPHTPHAVRLANQAHSVNKQVMLHLPMDSNDGASLGPGGLTLHMTEAAYRSVLQKSLDSVPHVEGLNNHMGSLLTRHPGAMKWLMRGVKERSPLFFIDSRTTPDTVAQKLAEELGVPNTRRDVFLDNDRDPDAIRRQFRLLLRKARRQGYSVGIGHPYPETLEVLGHELSGLSVKGFRLIRASQMIALQSGHESEQSSPPLKFARRSKALR